MFDLIRRPDFFRVEYDGDINDCTVEFEINGRTLEIYLTAVKSEPRFVYLRWNVNIPQSALVLGDKWERSYGDLEWRHPDCESFYPWYILISEDDNTCGVGVKVRPASFVSFECDPAGVTARFDVRNGSRGVKLNGRRLLAASVVNESYEGISAFEAAKRFCRVMCTDPALPSFPVYGSNNWDYAYGKSSREDILKDARLIAELTEGLENRPFMVIDDGWTASNCTGPWLPGEHFGDMESLAKEFKDMGVRPGIWVRPLDDEKEMALHPDRCIKDEGKRCDPHLDPTHPEVKEYIRGFLRRIKSWGYELVKHDFTSFDLFGLWGKEMGGFVNEQRECRFYDETVTNAEVVTGLYGLIREETEGMIIIACNTFSHLAAGLAELARTGDDTSGRNWAVTRKMGVNTLGFRIAQNGAFYMADADCVGILGKNIPWSLNKQWLELLAKSGTPLFVSAQPDIIDEEQKRDLKAAFAAASVQTYEAEPLDWQINKYPAQWKINGETVSFDWYKA